MKNTPHLFTLHEEVKNKTLSVLRPINKKWSWKWNNIGSRTMATSLLPFLGSPIFKVEVYGCTPVRTKYKDTTILHCMAGSKRTVKMSFSDIVMPLDPFRYPVLVPNYLTLFRRVRPCFYIAQVFEQCLGQCLPSSMSLLMFLLMFQRCAMTLVGYYLLEEHFRRRHLCTLDMYGLALMHLVWDDEDPGQPLYHCEDCLFLTIDQDLFHRHRAKGPFAHSLACLPYMDQTLTLYTILVCFEIGTVATCRYCQETFSGVTSATLFEHARGHGRRMCFRPPVTPTRARSHLLNLLQPLSLSMPYICMSHDVIFPNAALLYLHLCTVAHAPKHFLCPICARKTNKTLTNVGLLRVHIETKHKGEISCPLDGGCRLDIVKVPLRIHILMQHTRPLSDLPYPIRQAAYFKKAVEIIPESGYVVFRTPQSIHRYPNAPLTRWVAHAESKGLRLPIELDGSGYCLSQSLIDAYNSKRFGFKVKSYYAKFYYCPKYLIFFSSK